MTKPDLDVVHISSAVIRAWPERSAAVIEAIERLADVDVFHAENGKIVVVIEGSTSGVLASRLAEITLIEGVISANLVYEQIEPLSSLGDFS